MSGPYGWHAKSHLIHVPLFVPWNSKNEPTWIPRVNKFKEILLNLEIRVQGKIGANHPNKPLIYE